MNIRNRIYNIANVICFISPALATKLLFLYEFRKKLNLKNPQTLNEKILWLKLKRYGSDSLVKKCADKYKVREYVASKGYGHILNELLYTWGRVDEICWNQLPEEYVIKCNHGYAYNIVKKRNNTIDVMKTKQILNKWMHTAFWAKKAEINYRGIEKKIICEKYLDDGNPFGLIDYKVYTFNGKAKYVMTCYEIRGIRNFIFFDQNWVLQKINIDSKNVSEDDLIEKPKCLKEMLAIAEDLATPFPFVRVDFYVVENKLFFGEMTFTPCAGLDTKRLHETDLMFGKLVNLDYK